jgi:hypothetical protein
MKPIHKLIAEKFNIWNSPIEHLNIITDALNTHCFHVIEEPVYEQINRFVTYRILATIPKDEYYNIQI